MIMVLFFISFWKETNICKNPLHFYFFNTSLFPNCEKVRFLIKIKITSVKFYFSCLSYKSIWTIGDWDAYPMLIQNINHVIGQCDDIQCTLTMCVLHKAVKYGCDHHHAVNKIEICQKLRRQAILSSRFFVEHTLRVVHVKVSQSHDRRADSPCYCRRRQTVHRNICCLSNGLISWLRAYDVAVQYIISIQVRCISSRLFFVVCC